MFEFLKFLPLLFPLSLSLAGEGEGGGGEGGKGAGEEAAQLKADLANLSAERENLKAAKADLERKLDSADKELLSQDYLEFQDWKKGGGKGKGEEEDALKGVNLDEMTPSQIAKHILGKVDGDQKKAVKELAGLIEGMDRKVGMAYAQIDLTLAGIKHPELGTILEKSEVSRSAEEKSLMNSIEKIATENPTWGAEKVYKQHLRNVKEESDEKRTKEEEKAEEERRALSEKGTLPKGVTQEKQLTKEEAAAIAYKASFGNKRSEDFE